MKRRIFLSRVAFALFAVALSMATRGIAFAADGFRFEKDVARYEAQSRETPPDSKTTFFVGSSTFTRWSNIPKDFSKYRAINRGFGGSQISDWTEVASARLLTPYRPSRIVFFCGCNDIASGKSPEKVVEDFKTFLEQIRAANPDVVLHFCALHMPPSREKHWSDFRKFNASIKELCDVDPRLYYVDFATATSDENGRGRANLFLEDRLHLTRDAELSLVPLILQSIDEEVKANENK